MAFVLIRRSALSQLNAEGAIIFASAMVSSASDLHSRGTDAEQSRLYSSNGATAMTFWCISATTYAVIQYQRCCQRWHFTVAQIIGENGTDRPRSPPRSLLQSSAAA